MRGKFNAGRGPLQDAGPRTVVLDNVCVLGDACVRTRLTFF